MLYEVITINQQLIITPLDPDITFSDDPLRMLRAIRFATQLGFRIDEETFEAIVRNANRMEIVSFERVADEMNKIVASPKPSRITSYNVCYTKLLRNRLKC